DLLDEAGEAGEAGFADRPGGVEVVTSDRGLAARAGARGARVVGARAFLDRLDRLDRLDPGPGAGPAADDRGG
ncbi:MAG TPA: hypothetical protein VFI47_23850, partial [Acidimicrobiales bacterium]|nr:hypothetical protein [Acidimicrobiales bacterium]